MKPILEADHCLEIKRHLSISETTPIRLFYTFNHLPLKTLVTKKVMKKEIDSFGTSCYRYMLEIRRIDRVRNKEVLQRFQRSNLSNLMYKCQLRSLGHWIRKEDIIRRFALHKNSYRRNRRGRPRPSYNKHIQTITELSTEELERKVLNRQEWRKDVVGKFDPQHSG